MRTFLAIAGFALAAACGAESGAARPTVVLITVDTLRADRTTPGGHPLPTTPALAALAARGRRFPTCLSPQPETGPALAALLTSRYPREIGVRANGDLLPDDVPTLAEAFRAGGWRTGAFVSTYLLKPHACGLDRGFDAYDHEMTARNLGHDGFERPARETAARAAAWLAAGRGRPSFLWVHFYDPHGLYDPGPEVAARFRVARGRPPLSMAQIAPYQRFGDSLDPDDYEARYDGEISLADAGAQAIVDAAGPAALVAYAADHGEGLGEQGYYYRHGALLNRPALEVPLSLAGPGVPAGAVEGRVASLLDVTPMLLALAGLPALPGARGGDPAPDRVVFAEARAGAATDGAGVDVRAKVLAAAGTFRLLLWPDTRESVLYDLSADPGETRDASAENPEVAAALAAAARRFLLLGDRMPGAAVPADVRDALRGLGYIGGGGGK